MSEKNINFFELEVFCGLKNYTSVRALSRAKNLKPSHVSKILSRLESKVGTQLTIRTPSGARLTQEGIVFLDEAHRLLAQAESLFSSYRTQKKVKPRKVFSIGGFSFLNKWLLAPMLKSLESADPSSRFRLVDFSPGNLVSAGIDGAFDLAIHSGEISWPQTWVNQKIGHLEWALVARRDHPLGSLCKPEAALSYPFVGPCYWDKGGYVRGNDFCPIPWNKRLNGHETTTADTAAEIVKYSDSVAYLPRVLFNWERSREDLKEITVEGWKNSRSPLFLVAKASHVKNSDYQRISALIKQLIV